MDESEDNWFKDGVQFECTACGKCCQVPQAARDVGGMAALSYPGPAVNDEEIETLAAHLKMDAEDFRREFTTFCRQGHQTLVLKDSACVFYDRETKLCRVHEARPSYCRAFPFFPHTMGAKMFWDSLKTSCEGVNQGELISESDILEKLRTRSDYVYQEGSVVGESVESLRSLDLEDASVDPRYADE